MRRAKNVTCTPGRENSPRGRIRHQRLRREGEREEEGGRCYADIDPKKGEGEEEESTEREIKQKLKKNKKTNVLERLHVRAIEREREREKDSRMLRASRPELMEGRRVRIVAK